MAAKIDNDPLELQLREMKLPGMATTLQARLAQANAGELGFRDLVQSLADDEREHRDTAAIARRTRAAKFEEQVTLEDFDYGYSSERRKIAGKLRDLTAMRWQAAGESIVLHGPTGTGKSRVAQGLGQLAIRLGQDVRFTHTNNALRHLENGRAKGLWERRLNALARPAVLVLDAFAVREFTATETQDLYELITARPGKSMIVTSGRPPKEWYKLFTDKALAEAFLDRLVNTSHHVFMDGPSYRSQQRPGRATGTKTDQAAQPGRKTTRKVA
ncbi:ATP-binding protein [Actinomadura sp. 3N407]|uniref:ATP-binding protein n=1 Tax=Actinomadura sp. 3N407 TaxID=3457423 RepID=UPI003FCD9052